VISLSRYQTVLFDADNTLFDFSRAEREAITLTMQAFLIAPDEARIALYSRMNDAFWKRLERGEISKSELRVARFAEFLTAMGVEADAEAMAQVYVEKLSLQAYPVSGAVELVKALASAHRLYIVTNGIASVQRRRFAASSFVPYFRDLFISEEIGYEKPHPAFFVEVARRVPDFDAATTLVVGDSLSSDIAGGIAAGLDTCWYNPQNAPNCKNLPITYTIRTLEALLPLVRGA